MEEKILELISRPNSISENDLPILESEINRHPYMQSLRALQLLGIKKFQPENYEKNLSLVAAYTTEKKNLFYLLNSENQTVASRIEAYAEEVQKAEIVENRNFENPAKIAVLEKISKHDYESAPQSLAVIDNQQLTNGHKNRILFPGEENFLNEADVKIDHEATKEAGKIIVLPTENIESQYFTNTSQHEDLSESTVLSESKIINETWDTDGENVENDHDINFHETENFLPEMNFTPTKEEFVPVQKPTKHEDEMARLIAEVEAKMKKNKSEKPKETEPEIISHEINFYENHDETVSQNPVLDEVKPEWKPMNFGTETVSSGKIFEETRSKDSTLQIAENQTIKAESNVPTFINTWQSWLKILPKKEEPKTENEFKEETVGVNDGEESLIDEISADFENENSLLIAEFQEDRKDEIVDAFIQNNPRISKVSDEYSFTVKDRGDDISHLMTETLANLYAEQRLYSKAIKAYEILKSKFPKNLEKYNREIEKIKEMRTTFKP